ncbi:bifunctional metallophosphatase/5'-nucleotidase [Paenibacillus thailandensis]|uniref:Bifunctional metallophosphatase/5'-nucleotidase n=1 Tax=Paenibacillus thailandensis TaxID=393250 RepID=A0ABW5QVC1_9BACL
MEQKERIICRIMATSDIHGYIRDIDYRTNGKKDTGLAKLGSLIRQVRERGEAMLLIDNGDLLQGSPLASFAAARPEGTHPFIQALDALGYDAAVPGNHEFNYGLPLLRQAVRDSRFPWLSANIVDESTGEPAFGPPYVVKWLEGQLKAVILGLTTHYIPNWENPRHIEGLKFRDALEAAKEWVRRIRDTERPDLLIVSYHGGFERDLETGEPTERLSGENQGYAICAEAEGIDVLVTGHQHRLIAGEVNGVAVVQPGSGGQAVGMVTVELEKSGGRWAVTAKRAELLQPDEATPADEAVMKLTGELERRTQSWLDEPIGRAEGDLRIDDPFACRLAAHPFISFVHQVQLAATGAELSNTALLSEEARGFGTNITMRDVLSNFVYPNTLTVLRLTGKDIREALEQTAAYFDMDEAGGPAVSRAYLEPKPQHYNYDMWAGIEYELNVSLPVGKRVTKLTRGGEPVADDRSFTVVMSNYRAAGGGDYDMFRGKPVVLEGADDMAVLAADYIRRHGVIRADGERNWRVVAGS